MELKKERFVRFYSGEKQQDSFLGGKADRPPKSSKFIDDSARCADKSAILVAHQSMLTWVGFGRTFLFSGARLVRLTSTFHNILIIEALFQIF
ncbi:hypothetical protein HAX54_020589 [Datura stramonium]|uniref:Uncharacterized protein n=1 Tax=Datura stramonium TaxID=4076 RepID=A0ABS8URB9_DATST|nr:hypothetical protein [Datura stramonium]